MTFKDADEFYCFWCEQQDLVCMEAWNEFLEGGEQTWDVMDAHPFVRLVRSAYREFPSAKDRKVIDEYCLKTLRNYLKLEWNTIVVGHTELSPLEYLTDNGVVTDIEEVHELCDWIAADALSDYGLKPIARLLTPLFLQKNYSLKMQILADIIGVTHMRGDLSKFFVQDGRHTHNQIDVYESTCA